METGDKVLALLGAKVICCVALVLAATGVLGGFGAWLIDGAGGWLVAGLIVAAIVAPMLGADRSGRRRAIPDEAPYMRRQEPAAPRPVFDSGRE